MTLYVVVPLIPQDDIKLISYANRLPITSITEVAECVRFGRPEDAGVRMVVIILIAGPNCEWVALRGCEAKLCYLVIVKC